MIAAPLSVALVGLGRYSLLWPVRVAGFVLGLALAVWWLARHAHRWPFGASRLMAALGLLAMVLMGEGGLERWRLGAACLWWAGVYFLIWWGLSIRPALTSRNLSLAVFPLLTWPVVEWLVTGEPRPAGALGNPNLSGAVAAMAIPLILAWWDEGPPRISVGCSVFLGLCAWNVLLSQSMGAILAAGVGLVAYGWVTYRLKKLSGPAWVSLAGWAAFIGIVWAARGGAALAAAWSYRWRGWAIAWDAFKAAPLVGLGPRRYAFLALDTWPEIPALPHAHNAIAQWAAEGGVFGLIAAGLVAWVAVDRLRATRHAGAIACLAALGAGQILDYTLWVPTVAVLAIAALSLGEPTRLVSGPVLFDVDHRRKWRGWPRLAAALLVFDLLAGGLWSLWAEYPAWLAHRETWQGHYNVSAYYYMLAYRRDPLGAYEQGLADAMMITGQTIDDPAYKQAACDYAQGLTSYPWDGARAAAACGMPGQASPGLRDVESAKRSILQVIYRRPSPDIAPDST